MDGQLPNLVIAGVPKAGTTSLFSYLSQHEAICPSLIKELGYFLPHAGARDQAHTLAGYADQFAHCRGERYRMEASPGYAAMGASVARQIRDTLGNPKVLISLRDPTARLWSEYRFRRSQGHLDDQPTLAAAIDCWQDVQASAEEGTRRTPLFAGRYADYLADWMECCGDDFRIVFVEDLWQQPATVLHGLFRWLGIRPEVAAELDYSIKNPTVQPRSRWLARQAHRARSTTNRVLRRQPWLRAGLRDAYSTVNTQKAADSLDPEVRAQLDDFYAKSNAAVAGLLDGAGYRELPGWLRRHLPAGSRDSASSGSNDWPNVC